MTRTIRTSPAARASAAARQLDWLLGEAHGATGAPRARRSHIPWLAAACVLLGIGAVFGAAHWQKANDTATKAAQEPETGRWHECYRPADLAQVPADVRALRCYDFDDAACAQLGRFVALERLDLGAMAVDAAGVARSLAITDVGVRSLAKLPKLRWLEFDQCHRVHGHGLRALEALPQLEHLDLSYTGIVTEAVERLPRLPHLRSLVLSHCRGFRGGALQAIASMPGLQRLELAGCTTVTAAVALSLAAMPALRHLDLRDCQGRFRGQTEMGTGRSDPYVFVDDDGDGIPQRRLDPSEPVPPGASTFVDGDGDGLPDLRVDLTPPAEDGIGISDAVVLALAKLPLTTLRLGGCTSLTEAIGPGLAPMTALRELDLAQLPQASGELLKDLPTQLERLAIGGNPHWQAAALSQLPRLPALAELRADGLLRGYAELARAAGTSLQLLEVTTPGGAFHAGGSGPLEVRTDPELVTELERLVTAQSQLVTMVLHQGYGGPHGLLTVAAALSQLRGLELHDFQDLDLSPLAGSRTLQALRLVRCRGFDTKMLWVLRDLPLREIDLRGTECAEPAVKALAIEHWPDCEVVLPNGSRFRAR